MYTRVQALVSAAAAALLLLTGCVAASDSRVAARSAEMLVEHGMEGLSTQQIVDALERVPVAERSTELMASVRPDRLVLSDAAREVELPMPAGLSYVSTAPYASQTHECWFHSLTTCRGELARVPVHVTITDDETGAVLVDEATTTLDNGFVGYWLPRGVEGTITIEHEGRSGSATFSTAADDAATCITTLALA